jgi:hypothetical protein
VLRTVTDELEGATDCGRLAQQIEVIKLAVYGLDGDNAAEIWDGLDEVKAELKRLAAA